MRLSGHHIQRMRTALYLMLGLDLTAVEGLDKLNALTLISEVGTDMAKWPEDGREGAVEPDTAREKSETNGYLP